MIVSTLGLDGEERKYIESLTDVAIVHSRLDGLSDGQLGKVEVLITYGYDIPEETIRKMECLRWIHVGQSGMEKLPFGYIRNKGIVVTNSRGINSSNISEYVLCAMLMHVRRSFVFHDMQKDHVWDVDTRMGELRGATVGVCGLGAAGREVVKRAIPFDMTVLGMDIVRQAVPGVREVFLPSRKEEMFGQCDFVVMTMPLTKDTYHILDDDAFRSMKKGVYVINCGRGGLVDLGALEKAIGDGQVSGAALDVFEKEPLTPTDPVWDCLQGKIDITPHIAGDHFDAYAKRMIDVMVANLSAYPDFSAMRNLVDTRMF